MRRLWEEELLGEILSRDAAPCQTPPPEDVCQARGQTITFVFLHSLTPMRQLLRSNNSVQKQTIARIALLISELYKVHQPALQAFESCFSSGGEVTRAEIILPFCGIPLACSKRDQSPICLSEDWSRSNPTVST